MNKKCQLTLFFIFAIVILIAVSFIFSFKSSKYEDETQKELKISNDLSTSTFANLKYDLNLCFESVSENAILYISEHGGDYESSNPHISYWGYTIPVYDYENNDRVPTIQDFESGISQIIKEGLPSCIEGFNNTGFFLSGNLESVNTSIEKDSVKITARYPILIQKANAKSEMPEFGTRIYARLGLMHEIAGNISRYKIKNKAVCIDCVLNYAKNNQLNIDILSDSSFLIFTISDNVTQINN